MSANTQNQELPAEQRRRRTVNDRKLKILAAVIDEYIMTGEPVGSKAIASLPERCV